MWTNTKCSHFASEMNAKLLILLEVEAWKANTGVYAKCARVSRARRPDV